MREQVCYNAQKDHLFFITSTSPPLLSQPYKNKSTAMRSTLRDMRPPNGDYSLSWRQDTNNSSQAPPHWTGFVPAHLIATITLALGVGFMLYPNIAIEYFEAETGTTNITAATQSVIQAFVMLYSMRNVFVAFALHTSAYYRDRKVLGWLFLASGFVTFGDGLVARAYMGGGAWKFWVVESAHFLFGVEYLGLIRRALELVLRM